MRLIDADKSIEEMRKWYWDEEKQKAAEKDISPMDLFTNLAITIVKEQPTAFNVDKVIEELENLQEVELHRPDMCGELGDGDADAQYNDGVSQGRYEAFVEAIEIVKRGRRDEE